MPPLWLAGHIGWFAEWWIARNTQRAFGVDCPVRPTRLASIEPQADRWWNPAQAPGRRALVARPAGPRPDQGLPARHAGEHARTARARGRDRRRPLLLSARPVPRRPARRAAGGDGADARPAAGRRAAAGRRVTREPLLLPATRWDAGLRRGSGFAFAQERGLQRGRRCPSSRSMRSPSPGASTSSSSTTAATTAPELWRPKGWAWLARPDRGPARAAPCGADRRGAPRHRRLGAAAAASAAPCARPATRARCM